jgi:hypothetical protein
MTASRRRFPCKHSLLAIALAALMAACGGGGGGGDSTPVNPTPPPPSSLLPPATGPGDTLNYAPNGATDAWTYNAAANDGSLVEPMRDLATVWVNGTASVLGQAVTVYSERLFSEPVTAPTYDLYYQKGPGGVAFYGSNDATDTLTAGVVPYAELLFPVATGPIISFSKTGLNLGSDLDGDGRNETVDASQTISIAGFESVTVPAGTFPAAARRLNSTVANARLSSNGTVVTVNVVENTWLAPGAGIVKRETVTTAPGTTLRISATLEARGYNVSGVRKGMGNPEVIMPSSQGVLTQTSLGEPPDPVDTPAVASSGTNFLVVTKAYTFDPLTSKWVLRRMGYLRSPDGPNATLPTIIDIGQPVLSNDTREIQSLAYGGGTYLAVFEQRNPAAPNVFGPTEPSVVGQRISPAGVVIDPVPFVLVPQGIAPAMPGTTARLPQVAYGGGTFLVVYCGGSGLTSSTYIEGQLRSPDGTGGPPFRISPDFSFNGISPRVVFDGTNFIVATGDATGWRLTRVTPGGTVLDPAGVVVPVPTGRIQMTTSGAGGALVTWLAGEMPYARRFAANLAALDAAPIQVAMSTGAGSAINAGFIGGEYVVMWTQHQGPMSSRQLVLRMNRIALDGTVQGQSPPLGGLPSVVPYAALVSPTPTLPPSGYTGGYALPALGTGTNAALLAYVGGTANGMTIAERAMAVHGIWVHPFAR